MRVEYKKGALVDRKGLSARERAILDALAREQRTEFRLEHVRSLVDVPRANLGTTLGRLSRKGWLRRVRRGVYTLVPLGAVSAEPPVEDAWALAMTLFSPGYISGWSAAEHWGLTEQIFNSVAVVTARKQRTNQHKLADIQFRTRSIPEHRVFGTKKVWSGAKRIEMADPHRLLIDILDDPSLGGGGRHTVDVVRAYWASQHANVDVLIDYAQRYRRGTVFKRLGFLSERYANMDEETLTRLGDGISAGISKLDPSGPSRGPIVSRWNLRINLPLETDDL